jgi:hypothetical protein
MKSPRTMRMMKKMMEVELTKMMMTSRMSDLHGFPPFWHLDSKGGEVLFALVRAQAFILFACLCPIYVELFVYFVVVELHLCHLLYIVVELCFICNRLVVILLNCSILLYCVLFLLWISCAHMDHRIKSRGVFLAYFPFVFKCKFN